MFSELSVSMPKKDPKAIVRLAFDESFFEAFVEFLDMYKTLLRTYPFNRRCRIYSVFHLIITTFSTAF